jgi:hypothetical protein
VLLCRTLSCCQRECGHMMHPSHNHDNHNQLDCRWVRRLASRPDNGAGDVAACHVVVPMQPRRNKHVQPHRYYLHAV